MSVTDTDLNSRLEVLTKDDDLMKLESVKLSGTYIQAETNHTDAGERAIVSTPSSATSYTTRSNVDTKACILVTQWSSRLLSKWAEPALLRVISYHAADGSKIDDAMDGGVLKPIDDGTENSLCPAVTYGPIWWIVEIKD